MPRYCAPRLVPVDREYTAIARVFIYETWSVGSVACGCHARDKTATQPEQHRDIVALKTRTHAQTHSQV